MFADSCHISSQATDALFALNKHNKHLFFESNAIVQNFISTMGQLSKCQPINSSSKPSDTQKLVIKNFKATHTITVKPTLPENSRENYPEKIWKELQKAVVAIQTSKSLEHSLEELYKIYLKTMDECWQTHCQQMIMIRSIFLYLDRTYVWQNPTVHLIWNMGLDLFRNHNAMNSTVQKRTVNGLLILIEIERNGDLVDRTLLKSLENPDYLQHVDKRLAEENERLLHYLDPVMKHQLIYTVEKHLLSKHLTGILHNSLENLLQENRLGDLSLFNCIKNGLIEQCMNFETFIKKKGLTIVIDSEKDKSVAQDLLDFKDKLDNIVRNCFERDEKYVNSLREAFEFLVNQQFNKSTELIAKYVDIMLRSGNKEATEEELEPTTFASKSTSTPSMSLARSQKTVPADADDRRSSPLLFTSSLDIDNARGVSWLRSNVDKVAQQNRGDLETNTTIQELVSAGKSKWSPLDKSFGILRQDLNRSNISSMQHKSVHFPGLNANDSILSTKSFLADTNADISLINTEPHPTGIVLQRSGYYTIPTLEKLTDFMTDDGKCIVPNFTVGRKGYGNVYFGDAIDVAGLHLDELVHFRHKEVIIYPDDENKPPVGEGLNRKAQITLDQVWPHDKTLHEPIKDHERHDDMNYESKLRAVCDKHDTQFVKYRPETGSWVFKVNHFSKYGLSDSDEDELENDAEEKNESSDDEDEKKHQCKICSSSFGRKYHLKLHLDRVHSQEVKKFICPVCHQRIGEIPIMRIHFKRKHKTDRRKIVKKKNHFFLGSKKIEVKYEPKSQLKNGRFYGIAGAAKKGKSKSVPTHKCHHISGDEQAAEEVAASRELDNIIRNQPKVILQRMEDNLDNPDINMMEDECHDENTLNEMEFVEMEGCPRIKTESVSIQPYSFHDEFISFAQNSKSTTSAMADDELDDELSVNNIKIEKNTSTTTAVPNAKSITEVTTTTVATNETFDDDLDLSYTHAMVSNVVPTQSYDSPSFVPNRSFVDSSISEKSMPDTNKYRCHLCAFTTTRLNVIVFHSKTHAAKKKPQPKAQGRKPKPVEIKLPPLPPSTMAMNNSAKDDNNRETPIVKLVLPKNKGSIFKSRAANAEAGEIIKQKRHVYIHKWDDSLPEEEKGSTHDASKNNSTWNKFEVDFDDEDASDDMRLPSTAAAIASSGGGSTATGLPKFIRAARSNVPDDDYFGIGNVKKAHQMQEIGEFQEMDDDVGYILDMLTSQNPIATRSLAAIQLAFKCMMPAFRMHVRAYGTANKFFSALHDATQNQSLGLCTATIMFVLIQDNLNMDLDKHSFELMLNLLDSDISRTNNFKEGGLTDEQSHRIEQKVNEICRAIKNQGKAKNLNLETISIGTLAMETLLTLTSKRTGEWFKDEMRKLGGLEHIINTICECCKQFSDYVIEWTEVLVEKLHKIERYLRILENVSERNEENQNYILQYRNGEVIKTLVKFYKLCKSQIALYPSTDASSASETGVVLREALVPTLKVLINLTHTFNGSPFGSIQFDESSTLFDICLHLLFQSPHYIPEKCVFELSLLVLLLLINLVAYSEENRKILMKSTAPLGFGQQFYKIPAIGALIAYFYKYEEMARFVNQNLDDILDTTPEKSDKNNKFEPQKDVEDTISKLLQNAGNHLEHTFLASHVSLLIGKLITKCKSYEMEVRKFLRDQSFGDMVQILEKYYIFLNLTANLEAIHVTHMKETKQIIQFMKDCDASDSTAIFSQQ